MADEALKLAIRTRGSVKQKMTNLEKYIDSLKTSEPQNQPLLSDVEIRFSVNQIMLQEFEQIQIKIETICDEAHLPNHYIERELFETRYYKAISFLKDYLDKRSHISIVNQAQNDSLQPLQNIIIPKIKLPQFKGEYEHWLEFKTTFLSTIHTNSAISNTQKYQLLRASLEGYAKRIIDNVEFTEAHYETAWKLLCERFDNKKVLINKHIKSIFNLEQIHRVSAKHVRDLLDSVSENISALEGFKLPKETLWDILITFIIANKLDKSSYKEWKEFKCVGDIPTLDEFLNFLKEKADILETMHDQGNPQSHQSNQQFSKCSTNKHSQFHITTRQIKCNLCKGQHVIYNCSNFLKLSISQRIDKVNELQLCGNCLRIGHPKDQCKLGPCKKCGCKHNTLLHLEKTSRNSNEYNEDATPNTSTNLFVKPAILNTQVLLSTVVFDVKDIDGKMHPCRALLDSGAQSHLITEDFCKLLNVPLTSTKLSIVGINQFVSNLTKKCNICIFSKCNKFHTSISCYVIPEISNEIPSRGIELSKWNIPANIHLSDPYFHESRGIDVLIGASLFWELLIDGKIQLGKGLPILQNTKLGWVISGNIPISSSKSICNLSKTVSSEDAQLKRFWELEELSSDLIMSQDDVECEKIFNETTFRNESGQFVVKFPFKHSIQLLGNSKEIAIKRFLGLERRFSHNIDLKIQYSKFIHEYISLGHMTRIDSDNDNLVTYYLPHHGVLKNQSLTTKLRVVFDGSCPTDTGWSINDLQYTGPKIQTDIFEILLRFRLYVFVVSADVTKMYRQILMNSEHRPLQRIIWRDNPDTDFTIFQLNTVTYGTTAAPYLAIKCLKQLGIDNSSVYPLASNAILKDFYVDDLLTGSNDAQVLATTCHQISSILQSAGFPLRKWISNDKEVLAKIKPSQDSLGILNLGANESTKTLGIQWNSQTDTLMYNISSISIQSSITKRQILSDISQIYDPLGLVSPCVILSKIIIQKLWSLKLSWDEPISSDLAKQWFQFRSQLIQLNSLKIQRNSVGKNYKILDFHCFCDASQNAYATCVYVRSENPNGGLNIQLLCAKTKVAPIKSLSIPRLELCAALLGAQLSNEIKRFISVDVPYYYWTDSQIVLCWINTQPNLLEIFVANRISKIQSLTTINNWHYVRTNENPSDIASRGLLPVKLIDCAIWWFGPQFLYDSNSDWSQFISNNSTSIKIPELKKHVTKMFPIEVTDSVTLFTQYSDLHKFKRIFAYCLRFLQNLRLSKNERKLGALSITEIETGYKELIKIAQLQSFNDAITILAKEKTLHKKHKLSPLAPFLDDDGILRVGGRLKYSHLHNIATQPILLSCNHPFTTLIFNHKHKQLLHPGPQLLLASIRQQYWPIGGKNLAKKTVRNCITCFKFNPKPFSASMGALPDNRILPALPFQTVGIDYAGPLSLTDRKGRGSKISKCYVCIFICFVSKAIHLELVTDLTSSCFLACLKRFTSRRGVPTHIYSDNGTTFRGCYHELQSLGQFLSRIKNEIIDYSNTLNITWHFTPPYSPNFGGLWEAAVKSMKHHLKRTVKDSILTYEEFSTLLIQIEGILNSRPLSPMSDDPNDLEPLTPSHFLIGRPITSLPSPNLLDITRNRLTRYETIQQLYQRFWYRFNKEYVTQLHPSYKWHISSAAIEPGTLVLVKQPNLPPNRWLIGRILDTFPGVDGVIRVASVKTSKGVFKRSTRQLYPFPKEDNKQCTSIVQ